jgi:pimeloyl-ACP methyl ester carboxylesterase
MKPLRILVGALSVGTLFILLFGCSSIQRRLLYFPTHEPGSNGLTEWKYEGQLVGFAREVSSPKCVWLMLHGNAGQASDRAFALPNFSETDSVFIMEYPGYGVRKGTPSMRSFNEAALRAYDFLRALYPGRPICVVGESIGTGPASMLAALPRPPDKLVLVVPYDVLAKVAAEHFPFLPVCLLLRDKWNNVEALAHFQGPLEIFAASHDVVIPIAHARNLAATKSQAIFHEFPGGHSDSPRNPLVQFHYP